MLWKPTGLNNTKSEPSCKLLLFSRSVVSNSLRPCGLQHARLPCASPSPGACSNSCPLNWWCHPTISSSVVPFSSCLQPFPASGSFLMSWFFTSGSQTTGASVQHQSFQWVFRVNFLSDWLFWSPCRDYPRDSQESSPAPHFESINSLVFSLLYCPTLTSVLEKP